MHQPLEHRAALEIICQTISALDEKLKVATNYSFYYSNCILKRHAYCKLPQYMHVWDAGIILVHLASPSSVSMTPERLACWVTCESSNQNVELVRHSACWLTMSDEAIGRSSKECASFYCVLSLQLKVHQRLCLRLHSLDPNHLWRDFRDSICSK